MSVAEGTVVSIRGEFQAHCPQCGHQMDLLQAAWCGCTGSHPSKLCPMCDLCACSHPDYGNPICWEEAPPLLRRFGFARLFSLYAAGAPARPRMRRA